MVNKFAKLKLKTEFILNARKTVADDGRFSGRISLKHWFYKAWSVFQILTHCWVLVERHQFEIHEIFLKWFKFLAVELR